MMKKIFMLIILLGLQGCYDDISDVEQYVESVKVMLGIKIEPVPEPAEFIHFAYSATANRSPSKERSLTLFFTAISTASSTLTTPSAIAAL